jgi:hypothetical protein
MIETMGSNYRLLGYQKVTIPKFTHRVGIRLKGWLRVLTLSASPG